MGRLIQPAMLAILLLAIPCRAADFSGLREAPADIWGGLKEEGRTEGLLTLLGAGGAAGIATTGDAQIDDTLQRHVPLGRGATKAGDALGSYVAAGGAAAAYFGGAILGKQPAAEFGLMSLEALAISETQAEILKYSVRRERPDRSDHFSFPSGHASASFSVATVAACQFGWRAAVPAYLAAGFVGYTRLEADKHYLSDVLFGAGLGLAAGRAVWKARRRRHPERFVMSSFITPSGGGIVVRF